MGLHDFSRTNAHICKEKGGKSCNRAQIKEKSRFSGCMTQQKVVISPRKRQLCTTCPRRADLEAGSERASREQTCRRRADMQAERRVAGGE